MLHRESVVRVFLDERDKNFVGELPGLPELRIGTNLDELAVTWRRLFGQFSRFDKRNVCQG